MLFGEVFLPFARDHTRGIEDNVILLMDSCGSHCLLVGAEERVQISMFPPNSTSMHQPTMDMEIIAATKLHHICMPLSCETWALASTESLRTKAELTKMLAGTWGLAEGHPPHMSGTARQLKPACTEIDDTTIIPR